MNNTKGSVSFPWSGNYGAGHVGEDVARGGSAASQGSMVVSLPNLYPSEHHTLTQWTGHGRLKKPQLQNPQKEARPLFILPPMSNDLQRKAEQSEIYERVGRINQPGRGLKALHHPPSFRSLSSSALAQSSPLLSTRLKQSYLMMLYTPAVCSGRV